jgi:hypothetical protein
VETENRRQLSGSALAAAFVALFLWTVFTGFMVLKSDDKTTSEIHWTRLAWLFSSVEAVAFGAGGAVFGSSIQRERAEKAEQQAEGNKDEATKGRALAESLKAEAPAVSASEQQTPLRGLTPADPEAAARSVIERHARLARTLFPDQRGAN